MTLIYNKMTVYIEFYIPDKDKRETIKLLSEYFDKKYCPKIEKGLRDYTEQYCQSNVDNLHMARSIYLDCAKNLLFNCEQNNPTMAKIRKLIIERKYNPYNLAFLKPEEMDEDNWMKIILRRNNTEYKLKNLPTIKWKACHTCANTKYSFYQLQTRSADEPMTTFYTCKKCDRTYKVNN
jgi:DNA-directed RNA polymerase subunit M/transcription elongation factor TFIIS